MGDTSVSDTRNTTATFFDLYERGEASEDAIDDFVGAWHEAGDAESRPLSAFLGMAADEYAVWVMDARELPVIREARRTQQGLGEAVGRYLAGMQAAARDVDRSAIQALSQWLEQSAAG